MVLLNLCLLLLAAVAGTPFRGADRVTFTDEVNVRAAPSADAEVLRTLPLGTAVTVTKTGELSRNWGISAPWVQVEADGSIGWLWSGLLSDRFQALGTEGDGVVVGLRGLVDEDGSLVRVSVEVGARVQGTVLEPARADLRIPDAWTANGVPFGLDILEDSGIEGADPVVRVYYSADYCGGLMGHMVWARHEGQMVHLATLHEGSDAPVFHNQDLIFPNEEDGKPGVVLHRVQIGEHRDDGGEHYSRNTTETKYLVDGALELAKTPR